MDQIVRGFVKSYLQEYEIESQGDATDFEKFANYCVFLPNQISEEPFDVERVHTGKSSDTGLDGIGILVNNVLVNNEDEVDQEAGRGRTLDIRFLFLQAKTEREFNSNVIARTIDAVKDFFADFHDQTPLYQRNSHIDEKAKLAKFLLEKYHKNIRERPNCQIYYITNSRKATTARLDNQIKTRINRLKGELTFLNDASFMAWGCDEIERLYRRTKLQVDVTVNLEDVIELSNSISGVGQAYMATIKFTEFKKLIIDEDSNLRAFIFYDNIRGFLGEKNQVNQDIRKTIDSEKFNRFSILNNGITIIAKEIKPEKLKRYRLVDYQIVNGCQTSYVLYYCRDLPSVNDIFIPVKLIETNEDEIRNEIIKATNYQTEVPKELLLALSEFPKRLESYYEISQGNDTRRLYYERRPGQYHANDSIIKKRVVGIGNQIKTFAAMFLDEPHSVRYKKDLIDKIGKDIFVDKHHPIPYYTSSCAYYELEKLFSRKSLPVYEKVNIRYHILMIVKYLAGGQSCPKCSDQKTIEKYCHNILEVLRDEEKCKTYFEQARTKVMDLAYKYTNSQTIDYRSLFKKVDFTDFILTHLNFTNNNLSFKRQKNISNKNPRIPGLNID